MTLDQYGHLFPDDLDDVADKMDDLASGCAQMRPRRKKARAEIRPDLLLLCGAAGNRTRHVNRSDLRRCLDSLRKNTRNDAK